MILNGVLLEMIVKISGIDISMKVIQRGYFYYPINIRLLIQKNIVN